jgi:hypothetical protein
MTAKTNNTTSKVANRPSAGTGAFHDAMTLAHGAKAATEKSATSNKLADKKADATVTKPTTSGATDVTPVQAKGVDTQARPWSLNQPVGQPTGDAPSEQTASGTKAGSDAQSAGVTAGAGTTDVNRGLAIAGATTLKGLATKATNAVSVGAGGQAAGAIDSATDGAEPDGLDTVDGTDMPSAAVLDAGVSEPGDGASALPADAPAAAQLAAMLGIVPVAAPVPSAVAGGFAAQSASGLEGLAGLKANVATGSKGSAAVAATEALGLGKAKVAGLDGTAVIGPDVKPVENAPVDAGLHHTQSAMGDSGFEQMVQAASAGAGAGNGTGNGSGSGSEASSGSAGSDVPAQPAPTGASAGWDGALQPALLPAMSSAQLIQTMHQSEMRMGLNSEEFGNLSITTSISRKLLSAQIATEHAGLGRELAVQMPAFQEQLGKAYGLQARVQVRDDSAGTQGSSDGNSAAGQQSGNAGAAAIARGGRMQFGPVKMGTLNVAALTPGSFNSGNARLDVRA